MKTFLRKYGVWKSVKRGYTLFHDEVDLYEEKVCFDKGKLKEVLMFIHHNLDDLMFEITVDLTTIKQVLENLQ